MPENRFVDETARTYDRAFAGMFANEIVDPTVSCIAELAELRVKPDAAAIRSVQGDMAVARVDGEFSLVYSVFNTIMNLTTQDEQAVPPMRQLPVGSHGILFALAADFVGVDEFVDLTHRQISRSRHLYRQQDGTFREVSLPFRFVWPAELDLMARIAHMTLEHRWAGWNRSPFMSESSSHVSVWRLA